MKDKERDDMGFDSQFYRMLTFPPCAIVLDHFRFRPPRKRERCGQVQSDPNKKNPIDPVKVNVYIFQRLTVTKLK